MAEKQGQEKKQFSVPSRQELIQQIKDLDQDIEHVTLNLIKCDFNATEKDIEKAFPEFKFVKVKNYNPGSFEVIFEMRIDAINFIKNCYDKKILTRRFFIKMGRQQRQVLEDWTGVGSVQRQFRGPYKPHGQKPGQHKGKKPEGEKTEQKTESETKPEQKKQTTEVKPEVKTQVKPTTQTHEQPKKQGKHIPKTETHHKKPQYKKPHHQEGGQKPAHKKEQTHAPKKQETHHKKQETHHKKEQHHAPKKEAEKKQHKKEEKKPEPKPAEDDGWIVVGGKKK